MELVLHPITERLLTTIVAAGQGGYIFHGSPGLGRTTAALEVARRWNCQETDDSRACSSCRQLAAGSFPDLHVLEPTDKPSITIEQVRRLVQALSLSPYSASSVRVVLIDEAQQLTVDAQNALLKLIEEPPPSTRIIMVATEPEALLPTVRSRLVPIYFAVPSVATTAAWLEQIEQLKPATAARLAELADGRPAAARALHTDAATAERYERLEQLAAETLVAGRFDRLMLARQLAEAKNELTEFAARLQRHVTGEANVTTARLAGRLEALERFRRQLAANVAARVALERLMLEL